MPGTEAAFDQHALRYDAGFTFSETGRRQRARVWQYLEKYIDPAVLPDLLEVNCGTGEDAAWLAARGHRVSASDLSQQMLVQAENKAKAAGLSIRFEKAAFSEIGARFRPGTFDIVFSNFGGLNCIDKKALLQFSDDLAALLRPGGRFIAVIMGDNCSWEKRYFRAKGDPEKAERRKNKNGVTANIGGETFTTWYYSPAETRGIFAAHFDCLRCIPVGWALPPSYLEPRFKDRKLLLSLLAGVETLFSPFAFTSNRADHFLIDFRKKISDDTGISGGIA